MWLVYWTRVTGFSNLIDRSAECYMQEHSKQELRAIFGTEYIILLTVLHNQCLEKEEVFCEEQVMKWGVGMRKWWSEDEEVKSEDEKVMKWGWGSDNGIRDKITHYSVDYFTYFSQFIRHQKTVTHFVKALHNAAILSNNTYRSDINTAPFIRTLKWGHPSN